MQSDGSAEKGQMSQLQLCTPRLRSQAVSTRPRTARREVRSTSRWGQMTRLRAATVRSPSRRADGARGRGLVRRLPPGIGQAPSRLSDGPRLTQSRGGPLAGQQAGLPPWGPPQSCLSVLPPRRWLLSEKRTQEVKPEAAVHFRTRFWEPRVAISATSYRSHSHP